MNTKITKLQKAIVIARERALLRGCTATMTLAMVSKNSSPYGGEFDGVGLQLRRINSAYERALGKLL